MTDHNSPEAVEARKNQPDPIVMYLIVRKSLPMSAGKIAAQVGHAVEMLNDQYHNMNLPGPFDLVLSESMQALEKKAAWFTAYKNTSYRKVVLVAKDGEWEKLKMLPDHVVVIDAGLTEIAPNSETVIGLWPMLKSAAPDVVRKLQSLK